MSDKISISSHVDYDNLIIELERDGSLIADITFEKGEGVLTYYVDATDIYDEIKNKGLEEAKSTYKEFNLSRVEWHKKLG